MAAFDGTGGERKGGDRKGDERKVAPLLTAEQLDLVTRGMDLVQKRARIFLRRFKGMRELELLETEGKIAVMESLPRYDKSRGEFEDYAVSRIDGRMMRFIKRELKVKALDVEIMRWHLLLSAGRDETYNGGVESQEQIFGRLRDYLRVEAAVSFAAGTQLISVEEDSPERREYTASMRYLEEALQELTEVERDTLGAILVDGMMFEEAAEHFGVVVSTVTRRMQRSRRILEKALRVRGVRRAPPPMDLPWARGVLNGVKKKGGGKGSGGKGSGEPGGAG